MFCSTCGQGLVAEAAFCQACGARQADTGVLAEAAAVAAAAGELPPPLPPRPDAILKDVSQLEVLTTLAAESTVSPPPAEAAISSPGRSMCRRLALYGAVAAATLLLSAAIVGGVLYAKGLVDERDTALATAQSQIDALSLANIAFQTQVSDLTTARDQATADLATRTNERDTAQSQRVAAQASASSLQQDLDAAKNQVTDLQSALNDSKAQLDIARQDSSNQQQRANNSDARSAAIAAVLKLDDQIYSDFYNFLNEVNSMDTAVKRNDYFNASAAYGRAQVIAGRLDGLFNQRKAALAKI